MDYYGLHGSLKAKVGLGKPLIGILLKAADLLKSAKGCHLYMVSQSKDDPDMIWVTEVWDDVQAHDDALLNAEVRGLIGQAMPLLSGMPQSGQKLTVLGGLGLI